MNNQSKDNMLNIVKYKNKNHQMVVSIAPEILIKILVDSQYGADSILEYMLR